MKKSLPFLLVGIMLVIAGLVMMFVVVPNMKVYPEDLDSSRRFDLRFLTLLDADTMTFYRSSADENPDLYIMRRVRAEKIDGKKMLLREDQILYNGDEVIVAQVKYHPLDRVTLATLKDFPSAWKNHEGYWEREGLVIGWGLDTEKRDYDGWNDDTRLVVNLAFAKEEEHAGVTTYHFTSEDAPTLIDPAHVAELGLPTSLTIESLGELAKGLDIEDPDLKTQVETLLPLLVRRAVQATQPAPAEGEALAVPLVYYYDYTADYWVDPTTGVLIDTRKYEHRAVTFPPEVIDNLKTQLESLGRDPDALDNLLPLTVNEFEYVMAPSSTEDAKQDAQESIDRLTLFGTYIPLALIGLGVILDLVGTALLIQKK